MLKIYVPMYRCKYACLHKYMYTYMYYYRYIYIHVYTRYVYTYVDTFFHTCIHTYIQVSHLALVPPVIVLLNNSSLLKNYDLSSVRRIGSGAAPLAKETELQFAKKMGVGEFRQGIVFNPN